MYELLKAPEGLAEFNAYFRWKDRPKGIVGKAYQAVFNELCGVVAKGRRPLTSEHYIAASLGRLTKSFLITQGYDSALVALAIDADPPTGWTLGDLDAEMERKLSKNIRELTDV